MKKKVIISICVILVIVGSVAWYFTPVKLLNNVSINNLASIEAFNGNTGNQFVLFSRSNIKEIEEIVNNIKVKSMKRNGIAIGRLGTMYNLKFIDNKGSVMDTIIINSSNTIRKGMFFYIDDTDTLCVELLNKLEKTYEK